MKKSNHGQQDTLNKQKGQLSQKYFNHVYLDIFSLSFSYDDVLGEGTFGVVYQGIINETREIVAIKKTLKNPRFKCRELEILQELNHPNIIQLKDYYYTMDTAGADEESDSRVYSHLVMEYLPMNLYQVSSGGTAGAGDTTCCSLLPQLLVKLYTYQIFQGLAHMNSLGIAHRDIKPQNILVDPVSNIVKLCDFGSAKRLIPGQPNVSSISSRYYRAPELCLGSTQYSFAIDIWATGCILVELLTGAAFLCGKSDASQFDFISAIFGAPSASDLQEMGVNTLTTKAAAAIKRSSDQSCSNYYSTSGSSGYLRNKRYDVGGVYNHPYQQQHINTNESEYTYDLIDMRSLNNNFNSSSNSRWKSILHSVTSKDYRSQRERSVLCDLLDRLFCYSPNARLTAIEACRHPYFDDLVRENVTLPGGDTIRIPLSVQQDVKKLRFLARGPSSNFERKSYHFRNHTSVNNNSNNNNSSSSSGSDKVVSASGPENTSTYIADTTTTSSTSTIVTTSMHSSNISLGNNNSISTSTLSKNSSSKTSKTPQLDSQHPEQQEISSVGASTSKEKTSTCSSPQYRQSENFLHNLLKRRFSIFGSSNVKRKKL